jgi:hypothetical protein
MTQKDRIVRAKQMLEELIHLLAQLSDAEIGDLFAGGILNTFFTAILEPSEVEKYPNVAEFLFANKMKSAYIAALQYALTQNYSFKMTKEGETLFASPSRIQWFDDGVMLLDAGTKPFAGLLALYRNGQLYYPIVARDTKPGEKLGPDDFEFLDLEEFKIHQAQFFPKQPYQLDKPLKDLKALVDSQDNEEGKYQRLLQEFPWVLGAQYKRIDRHTKLDDKNIPDFTGVRVRDNCRDILETKPPFANLFIQNGDFSADFLRYWDQAERYLDFARREQGYLDREKGLRFDNPICYLILGFDLTEEQISKIRAKQRMNPAIQILTYNDLFAFISNTISLVKRLKIGNELSDHQSPAGTDGIV